MRQGTSLACLARVFLRLGTTAFGGPAAHIAMMEDEVVGRRGWLTHDQFLDYLGAANLIPGPNSTELVIHIGYAQAGWRGLLVAGASFILPAALIVTAIAVAYVEYGALPKVVGILYGIKPVVIAIVAQAIWRLGQSAVKTTGLALLGVAATVSAAAGMNEIAVLLAAGGICAVVQTGLHSQHRSMGALVASAGISKATLTAAVGENLRFALPANWSRFPGEALVMVGQRERRLMRDSAAAIHAALPGSDLEVVDGCGHGIPLQRPEWFNARVSAWLSQE